MSYNKKNIYNHLLVVCFLLFVANTYSLQLNQIPGPANPKYENVDVFIECDWGANENMVQATVFDKTKSENPHLLIYEKSGLHDEVLLIEGIIVRIFDHDSSKLLKTYNGSDYDKKKE
jgi:hypothetical protein